MELVKNGPDKTKEDTARKFDPQIVSVKSMSELCDPEKTKSQCDTTSIFENNLNAFIKEEEQDDDLVIFLNLNFYCFIRPIHYDQPGVDLINPFTLYAKLLHLKRGE